MWSWLSYLTSRVLVSSPVKLAHLKQSLSHSLRGLIKFIKTKHSEQFLVCSKQYVNVCYFIQWTKKETHVARKYWVVGKGEWLEIKVGEVGSCQVMQGFEGSGAGIWQDPVYASIKASDLWQLLTMTDTPYILTQYLQTYLNQTEILLFKYLSWFYPSIQFTARKSFHNLPLSHILQFGESCFKRTCGYGVVNSLQDCSGAVARVNSRSLVGAHC